jgi:hypothetical protein
MVALLVTIRDRVKGKASVIPTIPTPRHAGIIPAARHSAFAGKRSRIMLVSPGGAASQEFMEEI